MKTENSSKIYKENNNEISNLKASKSKELYKNKITLN